jgi:hypothetical protein
VYGLSNEKKKFGTSQGFPCPHVTCVSLHFNVGIFVLLDYRSSTKHRRQAVIPADP